MGLGGARWTISGVVLSVIHSLGPDQFTLPPQSLPTIADDLQAHKVSWKYCSADRGSDPQRFATNVDGVPLPFHSYCGICDPLTASIQTMTTAQATDLQNYGAFLDDVHAGTLPAVSFVRPFEALAGHPANSTTDQTGPGQPLALGTSRHPDHHG